MNAKEIGLNQAKAAYIAEISERNLQRIEKVKPPAESGKSSRPSQYPRSIRGGVG